MEYLKARNTQHDETSHGVQQRNHVCHQHVIIMESPIHHHTTHRNGATINQKDAPIWERVLSKIPV